MQSSVKDVMSLFKFRSSPSKNSKRRIWVRTTIGQSSVAQTGTTDDGIAAGAAGSDKTIRSSTRSNPCLSAPAARLFLLLPQELASQQLRKG